MKQVKQDIERGDFQRAYLFYGQETYLKQQYKQLLVKALLPDGGGMNFSRYEGRNIDINDVILTAETLPFFADRRVILVEDSGFFKNKADRLADYMSGLPDYLVLIFVEDGVDKRSRMYKAVQKLGRLAEFAEQTGEMLEKWILSKMAREGKKITRSDLTYFCEMVGSDMEHIHQELEKLFSYTMGRGVITREDIDAVCTVQITNRIFDMVRAVSARQQRQALDLYYDLLAQKEEPLRILYLLAREFHILRQVKELRASGTPSGEAARIVGIPPFAVKKYQALMGGYGLEELEGIVRELVEAEERVKTGAAAANIVTEVAIVRLSSPG